MDIFWLEDNFEVPDKLPAEIKSTEIITISRLAQFLVSLGHRLVVQRDPDKDVAVIFADGKCSAVDASIPRDFRPKAAILDLSAGGLAGEAPEWCSDHVKNNWDKLEKYAGLKFAITREKDFLKNCTLIAYLTGHSGDLDIRKILVERTSTRGDNSTPELLYEKNGDSIRALANRIRAIGDLPPTLAFPRRLETLVDIASRHDRGVLIMGESGTGKEGVATAIIRRYRQYTDSSAPLPMPINCGALLGGDLGHAEIFGFAGGNVTGIHPCLGILLNSCCMTPIPLEATTSEHEFDIILGELRAHDDKPLLVRSTKGWKAADINRVHGILFLDEIGDLGLEMQVRLLRAIDANTATIRPGGYSGQIEGLRFKVVSATSNAKVAAMARRKIRGVSDSMQPLRSDLFSRLATQVIQLESLRNYDKSRLEGVVWALLDSRAGRRGTHRKWRKDAVQKLAGLVFDLITDNDASFGEYRQISDWITLVDCIAESANSRGLPFRTADFVTVDDVEEALLPYAAGEWTDPRSPDEVRLRTEALAVLPEFIRKFVSSRSLSLGLEDATKEFESKVREAEDVDIQDVLDAFQKKNASRKKELFCVLGGGDAVAQSAWWDGLASRLRSEKNRRRKNPPDPGSQSGARGRG